MKKDPQQYKQIYKSALTLLHQLEPEELYATIAEEAKKLVNAKYVSIFLEEDGKLKRVYATSDLLKTIEIRKKGYTFKSYTQQKPYILQLKEITNAHPEFKKLAVHSDINIPLTYNNKTFGVLSALSPLQKAFTDEDLQALLLISPVASLALRNMQLYSELTNALKTRDLFISLAAHELKTPLTSMALYAELLMQKKDISTTPDQELKEKLRNEIARLSRLVNELMQINQIKSGELQFNLRPCDFALIVESSLFAFRKIFPDRSFSFVNQVKKNSPFISADPDKLSQVIINLLHNATKFSSDDKPIELTLTDNDTFYILTIKDYGSGINSKDFSHIFTRFYQGTNKKEGLGLGLYITKQIIDRHDGKIAVTSIPQKETIFSVFLPILTND